MLSVDADFASRRGELLQLCRRAVLNLPDIIRRLRGESSLSEELCKERCSAHAYQEDRW